LGHEQIAQSNRVAAEKWGRRELVSEDIGRLVVAQQAHGFPKS